MDESIELYCGTNGSDKVYFAQLMQVPGSGWLVKAQYGPRNGTLNNADKTPTPVEYAKAKKIYDKLVAEKTGKGYEVTGGVSNPAAAARSPITSVSKARNVVVAAPQLLNEIDEQEMAAKLDDPLYCAQEKFNGERAGLISSFTGAVSGSNKRGQPRTLPLVVVEGIEALCMSARFDGEMIGDAYYIFDLLDLGVGSLEAMSYEYRLAELNRIRCGLDATVFPVVYTAFTADEKNALVAELRARNAEGVVFKKISEPHTPGRPSSGGDWLKCKFWATATVQVASLNAKRSVAMQMYDAQGNAVPVGNVTVKPKQAIPAVGDFIEVTYLYAHGNGGSLVQPEFMFARTDVDVEDANIKQLKYRPGTDAARPVLKMAA